MRDKEGNPALSKAAAAYHPGRGVYRSAYKNARRLAATEINMAYRTADYERRQRLDFVVGIKVSLSDNHTLNGVPFTDICDDLQGLYPKDFKFTGWHPLCRCFAVPVLKSEAEMKADNERMLRGEEPGAESVNGVKDVPEGFKKWIADNKDRISASVYNGTTPYFLKDNEKYVHLEGFKASKLQKFTIDSRKEYLGHDTGQWQREYFNKENGGYLLVDKERTRQGSINKQERGKYEKELSMCQTLANNGYKVEYLKMTEGNFDIYLNGVAADLKKTVGGNMEKYAKKAITKQGAEMIVFELEKNTHEIQTKLLKLSKENIHGYYYFSDERDKIYRF